MRLEVTKRNVEVFLFRIEQGTGYALNNPLRYVDPDGAEAREVRLGTASFIGWAQVGDRFDRAALLAAFAPQTLGSGRTQRDLSARKGPEMNYPTQSKGGGCVLGCEAEFSAVGFGLTINVTFTYDAENNVTARIWAQYDPTATFIGSSDQTKTAKMSHPDDSPSADFLGAVLDLQALSGDELTALFLALPQVPNARLARRLRQAILDETERRAEIVRRLLTQQQAPDPTPQQAPDLVREK